MKIYHNVYGYRSQYATKKFPLMKKMFFLIFKTSQNNKKSSKLFKKICSVQLFRAALFKFIFVFYKGSTSVHKQCQSTQGKNKEVNRTESLPFKQCSLDAVRPDV
jgi:hypothetical protein